MVGQEEQRGLHLTLSPETRNAVVAICKRHKKRLTAILSLGVQLAEIALDEAKRGNKLIVANGTTGEYLREIALDEE